MRQNPMLQWGGFHEAKEDTPLVAKRILTLDNLVFNAEEGPNPPLVRAPPSVVTVSLSKEGTLGANLDWAAQISWGNGQQMQSMVCDYQNGVQIQVPAISVYVDALPFSPRGTSSLSTIGQRLRLSAGVGIGSLAGIPPTLTRRMGPIAGIGSLIANPPQFARRVSVYPATGAGNIDPYTFLRCRWLLPGGLDAGTIIGTTIQAGREMPIPGSCSLLVENIDAGQTMDFQVVWHLDA